MASQLFNTDAPKLKKSSRIDQQRLLIISFTFMLQFTDIYSPQHSPQRRNEFSCFISNETVAMQRVRTRTRTKSTNQLFSALSADHMASVKARRNEALSFLCHDPSDLNGQHFPFAPEQLIFLKYENHIQSIIFYLCWNCIKKKIPTKSQFQNRVNEIRLKCKLKNIRSSDPIKRFEFELFLIP